MNVKYKDVVEVLEREFENGNLDNDELDAIGLFITKTAKEKS